MASGAELLAVILKTGTAGCDVMELSRRLIDAFVGVETLVKTDFNALKSGIAAYNQRCPERKILGLGRVKILELTAAFELARRGYAARQTHVSAVASSADASAHVPTRPDSSAGCCRPANGRRNSGRCRSTRSGACFRSRSSLPSKRDVDLTWGLYGAGKMMGIALVDHLIITEKSHYSFADNGRLCNKEEN